MSARAGNSPTHDPDILPISAPRGSSAPDFLAPETLEDELRAEIAHSLASPVRGTSILVDLLAESLDPDKLDLAKLRKISDQLTDLAEEMVARLAKFSVANDS